MTIFVDQGKGRILSAVEGRSVADITTFLKKIARQAPRLKAVAIDMSHSYRKAIQEYLPSVDIVYDHYHISAMINRAIDDLRAGRSITRLKMSKNRWCREAVFCCSEIMRPLVLTARIGCNRFWRSINHYRQGIR